jgi:uncharacterized protein (DUF1697 family)
VGEKMTIHIALLRGINVGGHNIIKMADLKKMFESLGLRNVKTYIQSGNVLFVSDEESGLLREKIENEIKVVFGLSVPVVLRTAEELKRIIKKCPFPADALAEGESVQISFLMDEPSKEGIDRLYAFKSDIDEYRLEGKDIYLFFRQSIRNSKLAVHLQKIGVPGTVRNWKTVIKLDSLAKAME